MRIEDRDGAEHHKVFGPRTRKVGHHVGAHRRPAGHIAPDHSAPDRARGSGESDAEH